MNVHSMQMRAATLSGTALIFCLACLGNAADTLSLVGGKTYEGTFQGFKNGRFYFQPKEGEAVHEVAINVQSLQLDPAVTVSLKPLGKKMMQEVKLRSFETPAFLFEANGAELKLPASHVTSVDTSGDFTRAMQQAAAAGAAAKPAEEVDIEKLVKVGAVTAIHFHMASSVPSVRAGDYLDNVAKRSKGKVKTATVVISGWDDPVALRYGIQSVPQFWIYRRDGELSEKLSGDVTPAAIDAGLATAQKAPSKPGRP